MKDLAAFVEGAEEDFVCVNKLGYRLPATLDLPPNVERSERSGENVCCVLETFFPPYSEAVKTRACECAKMVANINTPPPRLSHLIQFSKF